MLKLKTFVSFILSPILFYSCSNVSSRLSITTNDSIVNDYDGNWYRIINIGKQKWLNKNLAVTHFRNGDPIKYYDKSEDWKACSSPAFCFYEEDTNNTVFYGNLYNWYVVSDKRGVCPEGWRVPSDTDWTELSMMFGGANNAGSELKDSAFGTWIQNNKNTNLSRFSALPSGHRNEEGEYERLHRYCYFWSIESYSGNACVIPNGCAHECSLQDETSYFLQDWGIKTRGMSIRCIKND
jgi:uncharacterized protein (TIGR02145 family)